MKYEIHGNKVIVTTGIKSHIEEKLNKLNKYFEKPEEMTAKVVVKVRGRDQIIEVTIPTKHYTLRNEENHKDLYAAVDLIVDKLERQIVKNKTKLQTRTSKIKNHGFLFENIEDKEEEKQSLIVKRKSIEVKPMNEEEAILQMNMIGHDFYVYKDEMNDVKVLYRRKDGDYGVIEVN